MKIVVLDGYNKNPGDLSWGPLYEMGEVTIYDHTAPEEVLARMQDAPIVLTNKVKITAEIMDQNPQLKYIGVTAPTSLFTAPIPLHSTSWRCCLKLPTAFRCTMSRFMLVTGAAARISVTGKLRCTSWMARLLPSSAMGGLGRQPAGWRAHSA